MRIRILPDDDSSLSARSAIQLAGCDLAEAGSASVGVIAHFECSVPDLVETLESDVGIRWVQLPTAGIEKWTDVIASHPRLLWTSAKGAYAAPVAEHAIALVLALLRNLKTRSLATSWGAPSGTSLYGLNVVIVGAGGVAQEIARLLSAFRASISVVRRRAEAVDWADQTVSIDQLDPLLSGADVVILAAALTNETRRLFGAERLSLLKRTAVLINIARGALVDSDALSLAIARDELAGAALDVTDPEPLPDGHALWHDPRVLITPHTADTMEMIVPLLAQRITDNAARLREGRALVGVVDPSAGY